MKVASIEGLRCEAAALRGQLEAAFSPETALEGEAGAVPSAGHCAAVAVIVRNRLGGSLVSAIVEGSSHWFNRIRVGAISVDVDITGDQFGRPAVQTGVEGSLYQGSRVRRSDEVREETLTRAALLARRAGLSEFDDQRLSAA